MHLAGDPGAFSHPRSVFMQTLTRLGPLGPLAQREEQLTPGPDKHSDLLVAMSVLALLGLRYPQRMLPILLSEVAWKLLWLGVVALPLWLDDRLEGATREQAAAILWVAIISAVVPWRHVLAQYVMAPGQPWRRRR